MVRECASPLSHGSVAHLSPGRSLSLVCDTRRAAAEVEELAVGYHGLVDPDFALSVGEKPPGSAVMPWVKVSSFFPGQLCICKAELRLD